MSTSKLPNMRTSRSGMLITDAEEPRNLPDSCMNLEEAGAPSQAGADESLPNAERWTLIRAMI